ncbi:MAG: hypothetical protein ACRCT0_06320 [Plesiomonas shigelloides]
MNVSSEERAEGKVLGEKSLGKIREDRGKLKQEKGTLRRAFFIGRNGEIGTYVTEAIFNKNMVNKTMSPQWVNTRISARTKSVQRLFFIVRVFVVLTRWHFMVVMFHMVVTLIAVGCAFTVFNGVFMSFRIATMLSMWMALFMFALWVVIFVVHMFTGRLTVARPHTFMHVLGSVLSCQFASVWLFTVALMRRWFAVAAA